MPDFSRRTVVRGTAWTVPVIAVAAQAPAFAVSPVPPPPPPGINFGGACGNVGNGNKGCGRNNTGEFDKTLQVPLTLSNPGPTAIVFRITGMFTCNNCSSAPTAAGPNIYSGITGVYTTPNHSVATHDNCTTKVSGTCGGGLPGGSVLVPAGTVNATYWIVSASTGSSSNFQSTIKWELLDATTCAVLRSGQAATAGAISPANCNGDGE